MAMGASAAFAQRDHGGAVRDPAAIMALLAEAHARARDRRRYDLAVGIFKEIEAGAVPNVTALAAARVTPASAHGSRGSRRGPCSFRRTPSCAGRRRAP